MFCSNCGKQIADESKFCDGCGAKQGADNSVNSDPNETVDSTQNAPITPNSQVQKSPKKKANVFIVLAVVLVAFLIGKFAIAPSMVSDGGSGSSSGSQTQTTNKNSGSSVDSANPAYDAIFDDTYIVHFQTFFNMEMENFAMKKDDGIIACADYGYKDDVVKQWVETVYIPVSEYTDAQKAEVETTFKAQFASIDALNCCTVTYKMSTNYFTITCTYSNVDQASNYAELYSAGILQTNTFISMSATETTLLGQGFVKK